MDYWICIYCDIKDCNWIRDTCVTNYPLDIDALIESYIAHLQDTHGYSKEAAESVERVSAVIRKIN